MKCRIVEEIDSKGKPFNYKVQHKILFFWITIPFGYSTYRNAQDAIRKYT